LRRLQSPRVFDALSGAATRRACVTRDFARSEKSDASHIDNPIGVSTHDAARMPRRHE
jgi:hypothetical protein